MPLSTSTVQSLRRVFRQAFVVQDIAESLVVFDESKPAEELRAFMEAGRYDVVGVSREGRVTAYVRLADLGQGPCGDAARPFREALVVPGSTSLADLVLRFEDERRLFVSLLGAVGGIVSRSDLQKPPARMWLFGMVTLIEMRLSRLIEQYAANTWKDLLSEGRLQKAQALLAERVRRGQDVDLFSCLQLADKFQIIGRSSELRGLTRFESRRQFEQKAKMLEKLRNNLAHSQDIVTEDWNTIVALSERLDAVLEGPPGLKTQDGGGMSSKTQLAIVVFIVAVVATTSVPAEERIYWRANDPVDSSWISSADLDGNDVQTLYACPGVCAPAFPAADGAGGKTYFYLIDSRSAIWRMNLDGSFPEPLVENVLPTDVAVDAVSGKLYWSTSSSIFRSELDGSGVESVLDGLDGPSGLSVDGAGDRLFWIEQSPSRLRRAGLDGANPVDLVVGTDFRSTTVDLAGSKIFWLAGTTLTRANFDGSSVEPLPLLLDAPKWIAFEPATRRIFVSVDGGIARVSSSLVFVDQVVSGLFGVGKVSVDSIPPPIGVPAMTRFGGAALLALIGVALWRRLSVSP